MEEHEKDSLRAVQARIRHHNSPSRVATENRKAKSEALKKAKGGHKDIEHGKFYQMKKYANQHGTHFSESDEKNLKKEIGE
jgi:hypothetical protein